MSETVLVTGGSSDLGCALIRRLLSQSQPPRVIAHAHSGSARLHALQEEFGDGIQLLKADFSDAGSTQRMAEEITSRFGTPRKIVHLPALRLTYERLSRVSVDRLRLDMSIQVEAAMILLQHFAAKMGKQPGARMVFVLSSVTHGMPPRFLSLYTVIKYAQLGLMRAAAAEYSGTQLTVNAVAPSMIETQFLSGVSEVAVQMSAAANPSGRNAQPDDVLGAIEFLLSDGSRYMTGASLPVTAGGSC